MRISPLAATRSPHRWPSDLPMGGHLFSPRFCPDLSVIHPRLCRDASWRPDLKKAEEAMEILEASDKRWQDGDMRVRRTAAGMLVAEEQFRRIVTESRASRSSMPDRRRSIRPLETRRHIGNWPERQHETTGADHPGGCDVTPDPRAARVRGSRADRHTARRVRGSLYRRMRTSIPSRIRSRPKSNSASMSSSSSSEPESIARWSAGKPSGAVS